jgi:hypothetical protein
MQKDASDDSQPPTGSTAQTRKRLSLFACETARPTIEKPPIDSIAAGNP